MGCALRMFLLPLNVGQTPTVDNVPTMAYSSVTILNSYMQFCIFTKLRIDGQSAGNQTGVLKNKLFSAASIPGVGSSETTRDTSNNNIFYPKSSGFDNFNAWFAGLTDGDGSLLLNVPKSGNIGVRYEVTLDSKDVQTLHKIKSELGYGSVTKRTGINAYRYRIGRRACVLDIVNRINGLLLTPGKHVQLIKICQELGIQPIIPTVTDSFKIIQNTAWLSGFFDAEGSFNILNKYTPAVHIAQKDRFVLDLIKDSLGIGHVRHDISWDGWIWTVGARESVRFVLNLFTKYQLRTIKHTDVITLKSILRYLDTGVHIGNHPFKANLESAVIHFRNRHKS
jgi:hypothetical protein